MSQPDFSAVDYDKAVSSYTAELNDILKTKLPAVANTAGLIEIVNQMKDLKVKCKDSLVDIINKKLIPNYEDFQRTTELQKTTIGLNYTKYHQQVKLNHLAPKYENLQHFKEVIVLNKSQEHQFDLIKKYIQVLYNLKPLLIDLTKNFSLLKKKLNYEIFSFKSASKMDSDLLIPEFSIIFKTCEIYNSLDTEVKKIFPDLNKYDVLATQFSKKILTSVDIPDEAVNIVNSAHNLLLEAISTMFIESSKNLEQNNKIFKKTSIKYAEVLDISLKAFPLLNENETGVRQYTTYIQSIISDAARDIITFETKTGKNNTSLFKLLKVSSAIINTHIDILSNYYTDRSWLLKVMDGILSEIDVQSSLIIDIELDALIREVISSSKDVLSLCKQDFVEASSIETFLNRFFDIIAVWNMFEKFFILKYTSFTDKEEDGMLNKPLCLSECSVNLKIKEILDGDNFKDLLKENINLNIKKLFNMEKIPDINRYIDSFQKVELVQNEDDYPVSSILDDFSIIFKKYLILFINTGNYQIFDEFLKNICRNDFINQGFIKIVLNKLGKLSILTTNLCQYLDSEQLNLVQQINSGNKALLEQNSAAAGKSMFNLQQYTANIFQQQQQQAVKLGKDLISSAKQQSAFVISNNLTDDVNMKNFHVLLIYMNTISALKTILSQLLVEELLEPEYNPNDELKASKSIIDSTFMFADNVKVIQKDITTIVDSTNVYIGKIIDTYTSKVFNIGIKNNIFEFSKKMLNSEADKPLDISQSSNAMPSLSALGKHAIGFNFTYVCSSDDLSDLSNLSEYIKKIELLLQPYENVMLPSVYYSFKVKICEFVNDSVLIKKFFKISKINQFGIIKLEKEINSIVKVLSLDRQRDLIDYSLKMKFEKILQIIEILNFDKSDFDVIELDTEDSEIDENYDVSYKYVLKEELQSSMDWLVTPEEINRIRMMLV